MYAYVQSLEMERESLQTEMTSTSDGNDVNLPGSLIISFRNGVVT